MKVITLTLAVFAFTIMAPWHPAHGQSNAEPGVCYAISATIGADGYSTESLDLIAIDTETGVGSPVTALDISSLSPWARMPGLAINSTGEMYAADLEGNIFRIDVSTGGLTPSTSNNGLFPGAIAFDASDQLYGSHIGFGGGVPSPSIVPIDPVTGVADALGAVPADDDYAGLTFDQSSGDLYGSTGGSPRRGAIVKLDGGTEVETVATIGTVTSTGHFNGASLPDIAFDWQGNLYAIRGQRTTDGAVSVLYSIDPNVAGGNPEPIGSDIGSDQGFSKISSFDCDRREPGEPPVQTVSIDVKTGTCPNKLNTKSQGKVNVAIHGKADFDVSTVDPSTILVNGVAPISWSLVDVSQPPLEQDACSCTADSADGFVDLELVFETQALVGALGEVVDGESYPMDLTGSMLDSTPIEGDDCVEIQKKGQGDDNGRRRGKSSEIAPGEFVLGQNYPNPFNPTTSISFALPEAAPVRLAVYNAVGQRVKVLVSASLEAGFHTATWDATDHNGHRVSTGLYIYRITAGDHVETRKMLLLE
jgi:hypothetical protein